MIPQKWEDVAFQWFMALCTWMSKDLFEYYVQGFTFGEDFTSGTKIERMGIYDTPEDFWEYAYVPIASLREFMASVDEYSFRRIVRAWEARGHLKENESGDIVHIVPVNDVPTKAIGFKRESLDAYGLTIGVVDPE
jgi:hypothetical protein